MKQMLMLTPHLKNQILAQMLPQQFHLSSQATTIMIKQLQLLLRQLLSKCMLVLLNHAHEQLLTNS